MMTENEPDGAICIWEIETVNQLANIMTKGLVKVEFEPLRNRLMGWDLNQSSEPNSHSRGSVGSVNENDPSVLIFSYRAPR